MLLPAIAAVALVSTTQAQEPEPAPCQLSSLVLLDESPDPGGTLETPAIADVALPGEACLFLQASFSNVFDIGSGDGGGALPAAPEAEAEFPGGCELVEVVGDVVTEMPELASAIGTVPEVSLSEEACGALKSAYGLLAAGELTPLGSSGSQVGNLPPITIGDTALPPAAPLDPVTSDGAIVPGGELGPLSFALSTDVSATAGLPACTLGDLLGNLYERAPEFLSADDEAAADDEAVTDDEEAAVDDEAVTEDEGAAVDDEAMTEDEEAAVDDEAVTDDEGAAADDEAVTDDEGAAVDDEAATDDEEATAGEESALVLPSDELSEEGCGALTSLFDRAIALLNEEQTDVPEEPEADIPEGDEPAAEEESTTPETGVAPEGESVEAEGSPTP
jgi:hypothetical protein